MVMDKPQAWVGLAGIQADDSAVARQVGHKFELLMLAMVFILVMQWHSDLNHSISAAFDHLINVGILSFFILQTGLLLSLSKQKLNYLKHNWLNLILIAGGILLVLNIQPVSHILTEFRPLFFFLVLLPWFETFRNWLSDTSLLTTLCTFVVVLVFFGVIMSAVDPAIQSPMDGIWWALVTVTTVGYGDIVPSSQAGRLIAGLVILIGLGLFAALTANFSAIFVQRGMRENLKIVEDANNTIHTVLENIKKVKEEEDEIMNIIQVGREQREEIIALLKSLKS